ncbi:MAG: GNAT family N-acetyltransferase [Acidobacteria bacterium]|nr:GNAT family N-acetyltransferase [Acidobacteriota bacterium]
MTLPRYTVGIASTKEILPLRMSVLRDGTPSQDPRYAEDDHTGTVHLVVRDDNGVIVATSSWLPRPFPPEPDSPAVQLRGMAVDKSLQSRGVGAVLLTAGIERARTLNATNVWARARDSALVFYERNGMAVVGDAFIDDATGMSHHLVIKRLS